MVANPQITNANPRITNGNKPNRLQMIANPQILPKKKNKKTNKQTKTQYTHPIHQVKQKLKSET